MVLQVRGAELNGQLVWSGQYMSKWRQQLVEVTLTNPNVDNLKLAVSLPRLETLSIHYVFNEYKLYYHVPELKGVRGCPSLKRLFCGKDVSCTRCFYEALIGLRHRFRLRIEELTSGSIVQSSIRVLLL